MHKPRNPWKNSAQEREKVNKRHINQGIAYLHTKISQIKTSNSKKLLTRFWQWFWQWLAINKKKGIDILGGFFTLLLVSIGLPLISNYMTMQQYYNNLLDNYITQMEHLLIDDKLHDNYLEIKNLKDEEKKLNEKKSELEKIEKQDAQSDLDIFVVMLDDESRIKYFNEQIQLLEKHPGKRKNTISNLKLEIQKQLARVKKESEKKTAEIKQVKSLALSMTENALRTLSRNDSFGFFPGTRQNPKRRQLLINYLSRAELGFKSRKGNVTLSEKDAPSPSFFQDLDLGTLSQGKEGLDLEDIILDLAILNEANFTNANLTNARLASAELKGAYLEEAKLINATLIDTHLTGAHLTDADLTDAHLTNAHLTGAHLTGAHLTDAHLTDADLTGADLTGADLTGADLRGAILKRAKYDGKTKLQNACYNDLTVFPDRGFKPLKYKMYKLPVPQKPCPVAEKRCQPCQS